MTEARTASGQREASRNGRRPNAKSSPSPAELARRAARDLGDLLGREPESVIGLARTDGGWCIELEVLDTPRVPSTSDILAEYAVDVDLHGRLLGYRRVRRYPRGRLQDDL